MTLAELLYSLQLKSRCAIADVTPQWCAEAAECLEPLVSPPARKKKATR